MWKKLCGLVLVINIVYVTLGVAKYGSQHVDAYGIWMLKAKAWTEEGGVPLTMLRNPEYRYSHQQYPLLLPAMMAGWAQIFGNVESFVWVYPILYSVVLVILYRLTQSVFWTTTASFMGPLMAQGGRGHAGLADIWITVLVGLGLLAMRNKQLWQLMVAVMIASQIKLEGIFLVALFVGMNVPWKRKIPWVLGSLIPFWWWQWQVRAWALSTDLSFVWPGVVQLFSRAGLIVVLIVKEMLNWRNWYVVWPLWWLLPKGNEVRLLGIMMLGYVGVYLLANLEPTAYVGSSVDRVMLQLLPLWWVAVSPTIQVWLEREFVLAAGLVRQILQSRRGVGLKR